MTSSRSFNLPRMASAGGHEEQPWLVKSSTTVGLADNAGVIKALVEARSKHAPASRIIFCRKLIFILNYPDSGEYRLKLISADSLIPCFYALLDVNTGFLHFRKCSQLFTHFLSDYALLKLKTGSRYSGSALEDADNIINADQLPVTLG